MSDPSPEFAIFEAEMCHVFRIPPGGDTQKSESWEGHHIWTGKLRVYQDRIELFDESGVFGACPLRDDPDAPTAVQPTSDSRRCFVVRVEQGAMFAYLGINFESHSLAFQFHTAVLERHRTASNREAETVEVHDRRLRPGETLSVDLFGKIKTPSTATSSTTGPASSGAEGSGFNLQAVQGMKRTGASRRVGGGAGSTATTTTAPQAPPAPPASVPMPDLSTTAAVTRSAPSTAGAPPTDTSNVDPFDPFSGGSAQPATRSVPPPQQASAPPAQPKKVDPLDALFS